MDIKTAIEPVTVLKTKSAELIKRARRTKQPVIITQRGKATAVLQDAESFERGRKALFLLKLLAQGDEDYRAGRTLSHEDAQAHFSKKLNQFKHRG